VRDSPLTASAIGLLAGPWVVAGVAPTPTEGDDSPVDVATLALGLNRRAFLATRLAALLAVGNRSYANETLWLPVIRPSGS